MLNMGFLYNQVLADVRSTGVGFNCLYCMVQRVIILRRMADVDAGYLHVCLCHGNSLTMGMITG